MASNSQHSLYSNKGYYYMTSGDISKEQTQVFCQDCRCEHVHHVTGIVKCVYFFISINNNHPFNKSLYRASPPAKHLSAYFKYSAVTAEQLLFFNKAKNINFFQS